MLHTSAFFAHTSLLHDKDYFKNINTNALSLIHYIIIDASEDVVLNCLVNGLISRRYS